MCPVPIHGSLVIITSPGLSVCAGNTSRKCFTVAGRLPMNDAIDIVDCASERPSPSVSTTAKSFASRTSTEKEVRMNAVDASSTMLTRRFQWISSEIGSSVGFRRVRLERTGLAGGRLAHPTVFLEESFLLSAVRAISEFLDEHRH